MSKNEDVRNKNIPKVVVNSKKQLLYISRSPVPAAKDTKKIKYYKQVCIYAFNKEELMAFTKLKKKSNLEKYEDIEILRFFELDKKIKMIKTHGASLAVDVPSDIKKVENFINNC